MKAIWKRGLWISAAAVALVLSTDVTEAKADGGPEWNATIVFGHYCIPCSPGNVGRASLCPCRIADPIIINQE